MHTDGGLLVFSGFREFIMRGNVIDLAVAVVIGSAFAAVVATVVSAVIEPVLAAFGGVDTPGWGFFLRENNPATFVDIGAIVSAVVVFLITAAVVYVLGLGIFLLGTTEFMIAGLLPEPGGDGFQSRRIDRSGPKCFDGLLQLPPPADARVAEDGAGGEGAGYGRAGHGDSFTERLWLEWSKRTNAVGGPTRWNGREA